MLQNLIINNNTTPRHFDFSWLLLLHNKSYPYSQTEYLKWAKTCVLRGDKQTNSNFIYIDIPGSLSNLHLFWSNLHLFCVAQKVVKSAPFFVKSAPFFLCEGKRIFCCKISLNWVRLGISSPQGLEKLPARARKAPCKG